MSCILKCLAIVRSGSIILRFLIICLVLLHSSPFLVFIFQTLVCVKTLVVATCRYLWGFYDEGAFTKFDVDAFYMLYVMLAMISEQIAKLRVYSTKHHIYSVILQH